MIALTPRKISAPTIRTIIAQRTINTTSTATRMSASTVASAAETVPSINDSTTVDTKVRMLKIPRTIKTIPFPRSSAFFP